MRLTLHPTRTALCLQRGLVIRAAGGPQGWGKSRRRLLVGAGVGAGTGLALLAGAGVVAAAAAAATSQDPQRLVRTGMDKFRRNDVEGSLADFDAALALGGDRIRPYLWQRGLSCYYVGQFEEGAKQFRDDVAVNPNDTEEAIWAFLCDAQLVGPAKAREAFLQVGTDPRPVMRAAYESFRAGSDPEAILAAAGRDRSGHGGFYAHLYVGLWYEAQGDAAAAQEAILAAVATQYAKHSGDYMADLARVHCQRRGWA